VATDGRVIGGCGDGYVRVWEEETGNLIVSIECHKGWVLSLAVSSSSSSSSRDDYHHPHIIITGGDDGFIRIWDLDTGTHLRQLDGHNREKIVHLSANKDRIISVSIGYSVVIWDAHSGGLVGGSVVMVVAAASTTSGWQ